MGSLVQLVSVAISAALLFVVIALVRRRRLTEEYSFLWIVFALALLGLSVFRGVLDAVARWLGIFYPPAVLLLMLIFFVFIASLYFSMVISRQRQQIERLVEDQAILEREVAALRNAGAPSVTRGNAGSPPSPPSSANAAESGS
jgi:hypothetical protein